MGIRKWKEKDIEAIVEIENQSFTDPWQESLFKPLLKPPYTSIVFEEDNAVLGYAVLFDGVYDWELINIAVSPTHKKRGVGRALMKDCIERAKKANADRLLLEVRPSNAAAIGLYRAFGFKDDGIRKGYYADGEDALLMSLNLSTVSI